MQKTFTTQPKRYVPRGTTTSLNRVHSFMFHLWKVGLKKCSYSTLEFEFIQFFGTNEKRTLERYMGRLEQTLRYGSANLTRVNMTNGRIAMFHYNNQKRILGKKGLLEILGYVTRSLEGKETLFTIHHENMNYYTEQMTLENAVPNLEVETIPLSAPLTLTVTDECSSVSKDNLCACSLCTKEDNKHSSTEGSLRETVECPSTENIEIEKKEEEVIDSAHTNQDICHILETLKNAKSCDEPDRSKLEGKGFLCSCGHQNSNSFFCEECGLRNVLTYG